MTDLTRPRGHYFEEIEIGDTFETPSRTITEADVMLFAGLSGDYNQLHTDVEFTKETMFFPLRIVSNARWTSSRGMISEIIGLTSTRLRATKWSALIIGD